MPSIREGEELLLAKTMGLDQADIERRLGLVDFKDEDVARVRALADVIAKNGQELTAAFFEYLKSFAESSGLFGDARLLQEAQSLKREHLSAMTRGSYGAAYAAERLRLGLMYAKAGLETKVFLGAFHHLMRLIGFKALESAPAGGVLPVFEQFMALKKVAFFDISIIVDVIIYERERVIRLQQESIRELSTPALLVKDRLLVLPIIGMVDTERARLMTHGLLAAIRRHRAVAVVIDITGVPVVDSKVANHLAQAAAAARLMGASAIISGISAEVPEAMVALGVDGRGLITTSDLRGGLERAERMLTKTGA